jgi:hypothetical protein
LAAVSGQREVVQLHHLTLLTILEVICKATVDLFCSCSITALFVSLLIGGRQRSAPAGAAGASFAALPTILEVVCSASVDLKQAVTGVIVVLICLLARAALQRSKLPTAMLPSGWLC